MATREGYLLVDHQASPGLPEEVARASGYDPKLCREGKRFEAATLTCAHCKASVVKNPLRQRERYTCFACGIKYICDICAQAARQPGYNHLPFEKLHADGVDRAHQRLFCDTPVPLVNGIILP